MADDTTTQRLVIPVGTQAAVEVGSASLGEAMLAVDSSGEIVGYSTDGGATWVWPTGGAGALDDLSDVTITTPATGDMLRYNGSAWVNTPGRWEPVTTNPGTGPELVWDGDEIVMTWSDT